MPEQYEVFCLHCGMKALLEGRAPATFDETPEEHMARCHPDREACEREREKFGAELEERFAQHTRN